MRRRTRLILISLAILIGIGLAALYITRDQSKRQATSFSGEGVSLNYHEDLSPRSLSKRDKSDKFILRLGRGDTDDLLINLRYETGLQILGTLSKNPLHQQLADNAARNYPERFPEYKEQSRRTFKVDGRDASELVFSYTNKGVTLTQRLVIAPKDDATAYYFTGQTRQANYEVFNRRYFEPAVASLAFD
jgi:hypothetical protein